LDELVGLKDFFMMKLTPLLILLLLASACDAPQRTRAPVNYITGNNLGDNTFSNSGSGTTNSSGNMGSGQGTNSGQSTGTSTGSGQQSSPGFENCDLSDKYHTIDIGHFGICQSTQDETIFKFRTSLTSNSVKICLIPTYKDGNGASTYIGNPQCTFTTSNQVIQGRLYKDRPGFSNYALNGVIVLKEPLIPEYINCMHGYVNWPTNICPQGPNSSQYCAYWVPRCPYGARSNPGCDNEGRNYMGTICNNFKSKYTNSYLDIRTK
jgi:hypothetical protein